MYETRDDQLCKEVPEEQREIKLRGDYKEILEHVIFFLSSVPESNVKFKSSDALHQVRWMSKTIHLLKTLIFNAKFK